MQHGAEKRSDGSASESELPQSPEFQNTRWSLVVHSRDPDTGVERELEVTPVRDPMTGFFAIGVRPAIVSATMRAEPFDMVQPM